MIDDKLIYAWEALKQCVVVGSILGIASVIYVWVPIGVSLLAGALMYKLNQNLAVPAGIIMFVFISIAYKCIGWTDID